MSVDRDGVLEWIKAYAAMLAENRSYLVELDAAIGDADHGANMDRGFKAVLNKMPEFAEMDIGSIFKAIGMTLVSTVGGASGPLYGTFFLQAAAKTAGKMGIGLDDWIEALEAAVHGVVQRGKAGLGDKTMLDTLLPAVDALKNAKASGATFESALKMSAQAAKIGMESTIPLIARKGRASYLGERSAGHQDPGATSSYLLILTAAQVWAKE